MKNVLGRAAALFLMVLMGAQAYATVPLMMPTQGVLRDNAGVPVAEDVFAMTFTLYTQQVDGDQVWQEEWPSAGNNCQEDPTGCVHVQDGIFSVMLGAHAPLTPQLFRTHGALWLGVSVEGEPELPRRPLASTGFAHHAASAEIASGLDCQGCVGGQELHPDILAAIESQSVGPDSLDEVSNGTLTNEFVRDYEASGLPAVLGLSLDAHLQVTQPGELIDIALTLTLSHPFPPDLELRLLRPGDPVGVQLVAAGDLTESPTTLTFDADTPLPGGGALQSMVGLAQQGVWALRVSDTVQNGNEGQGALDAASLTLRYLASAEVGIKMPDGSVQLVGPEQNDTLMSLSEQVAALETQLGEQVATLAAELWCLKSCDEEKISDCQTRSCDGGTQTCTPTGPMADGTDCLGGAGVCQDGSCCNLGTCAGLNAECGTIDDGCGGVLACGTCGLGQGCSDNTCVALGSSFDAPAESCEQIKLAGLGLAEDGVYWITVNNISTQVHCNMSLANGGWALVMQVKAGHEDGFGYQSQHWTGDTVVNDQAPTTLTDISAKYATFNYTKSTTSQILLVDKESGKHSVLQIPGLLGATLLTSFATLPKSNLTVIEGEASPQELMGYGAPTEMCGGADTRWMINALTKFAGVRLGNDVATNDIANNNPSSWKCHNDGLNLSYSGVGGTLEDTREWQDGYGSESLNRWRDNGGTGQGSHNGLAIYVK